MISPVMDLQISGKHIDIGDALRTHVADRLAARVGKFVDQADKTPITDAHVTFSREGQGFRCETGINLRSGLHLQSRGTAYEIYASFDEALERLEKRMRRYRRRLKDHAQAARQPVRQFDAPDYVLETSDESEEQPDGEFAPMVVAETTAPIKALTVSEAVLQFELTEAPALLFENVAHGGLNMIYKRADGHIGWIDPQPHSKDGESG